MLAVSTNDTSTLLLLLILVVAVHTDMRRHRIPNWLSFGALVTGLLLSYLFLPHDQIHNGLIGACAGFALLLPFYLMGGMGAGDVKLMMAIGSFVGPLNALIAVGFTLIAGGCMAITMVLKSGELSRFCRRYQVMISARTLVPAEAGSVARRRFPYALPIAIGTLIAIGLEGHLGFTHLGALVGSQLHSLGVMR